MTLMIVCMATTALLHATPPDAIGVRVAESGAPEFYNQTTGSRFVPLGFNHTVLAKISDGRPIHICDKRLNYLYTS